MSARIGSVWLVGMVAICAAILGSFAWADDSTRGSGQPAAPAATSTPEAAPHASHYAVVPAGFKETTAVIRTNHAAQPGGADPAAIDPARLKTATFGAGCFWGVEARFRELPGVTHTAVGYLGGKTKNPTYKQVCTDSTGHAEVVQLLYNPDVISYEKLLDVFFTAHDPTTLNRQGPDFGSQYRSAVFFHDEAQQAAAQASKDKWQASGRFSSKKIVTEIAPAGEFYIAEEYHQQYLEKRGVTHCHTP